MQGRFKNLLLTTVLAGSLTACGGGGGGGGVGVSFDPTPTPNVTNIAFNSGISGQLIGDFISVVHTLSQDELLDVKDALTIFKWVEDNKPKFDNNELANYRITIDNQEMSLQKGFNMLLGFKKRYYDGKETFWENTAATGQFDDENEDYLALKTTAEEDQNKDQTDFYNELESTGQATVTDTSQIESFEYTYGTPVASDPVVTYTDWALSTSEDGESTVSTSTATETTDTGAVYEVVTTSTSTPLVSTYTRTKTSTTAYTKSKTTIKTVTTITTYSNGVKSRDITKTTSTETVSHGSPDVNDTVESRQETTERDPVVTVERTLVTNPVIETVALDDRVTETVTESANYTETTFVLSDETGSYTEEGSAETTHSYTYEDSDVDNGDGTLTRTRKKYTVTTTVTPVTTYTTKVKTYTDTVYKDVTTTTSTTPRTQKTYADGTTEVVEGTATEETAIVKTFVSTSERSETVIVDSELANNTTTSTDSGEVVSITVVSTLYTDLDPNIGTKTPGYNSDATTYQTTEYNTSTVLNQINANDAYAKGWTGKGVKIAVADTGYDIDHTDFSGQVFATKDYTGTGMNDNHGHGSHVLGTVVAKKNDTGTHGVAFDSTAAVIKIGDGSSVNISNAASGFSWAADNGAVVGNLSANSNYDVYFRRNITNKGNGIFVENDERYDYSAGQVYNMQNSSMFADATDKGLVVVNSAGNQGLSYAANPGYFATTVDNNGDLVHGGKILIVGSVDSNNYITNYTNKAGHICKDFNTSTDTCNDQYKVSDFYILAPGTTVSTNNSGGTSTMTGTSMAAPIVTGGVAVISQMWPYMKGENIVQLLLNTADKDIPEYNENTHGQGLLDLDAATEPQGAVGIPTTGRTTSSVSTVSLSNSGGSGSSISAFANNDKLSSIMIVDSYARDYYVDLTSNIAVTDTRKVSDVIAMQNNMTYLPLNQMYGSFSQGGQWDLGYMSFGIYSGDQGNGDWSSNLSKTFALHQNFEVTTTVGSMMEKNTWLGNATDGALAVGGNNTTNFAQIGLAYKMDNNKITLDFSEGQTKVNTVDNSVIKGFDTLETQSLKLGFERNVSDNKKWGLTYSLPSRITNGQSHISVPYATTSSGEVIYDNVSVDMSSKSKEQNIGFFFASQGDEDTEWTTSFNIEYRSNIAGVEGENKVVSNLGVSKKFWGSCQFLWMKNDAPFCEKLRLEKKIKKVKKGTDKYIELEDKIAKLDLEIENKWKK